MCHTWLYNVIVSTRTSERTSPAIHCGCEPILSERKSYGWGHPGHTISTGRILFLHGWCVYTHHFYTPHSGELRTQKWKSHLVRIQSLKVLPLKHGVGQYIAIHAMLTVRDSSLQIFILPVHSPAFFPNLSRIFPVLAVANTGSCVCLQKKRSFCWTQVPVLSARGT